MKHPIDILLNTSGQRLKYIRKLLSLSQKKMSQELNISQSTLSQIENNYYTISLESLERLQAKYDLNCNWFVSGKGNIFLSTEDKSTEEVKKEIFEKENIDKSTSSKNLSKSANADDIPLVDKNVAGYLKNHGSSEYLKQLAKYQIPGFEIAENHHIFQVEGDSMQPTLQSGDFLICEFCNRLDDIENGDLVVVVSDKGIFSKRICGDESDPTYFILKSDNEKYPSFIIKTADVREIWNIRGRITTKLYPSVHVDEKKIAKMEHDIESLKSQLKRLVDK